MSLAEERRRRIVTTHTGSLPRPDSLTALMVTRRAEDAAEIAREVRQAVNDVVARQLDLGVDVVSDGEQSKKSFQLYAVERLAGVEAITPPPGAVKTRENVAFPAFYPDGVHAGSTRPAFACTGPLSYTGQASVQADIDNLKAALAGRSPVGAFLPSLSPASLAGMMVNRHYKSDEEHLYACAEAIRPEYEAIVAAGFDLQVDDPRLAMHYMMTPEATVEDARTWARGRIAALNHALRNIPPERVRHHTCYGINIGPRTSDFEMKHLADLIVTINAGAYSFELANPRHEHEWRIWEEVKLPEGKVLLPGCITHASVIVEHPDLVAERIVRLANVVGRERVMASSDCGFASTPRVGQRPEIEPEIVWAKFEALVEGARRATKELWG
jgi:5-methyltetrahydropteroyltriglutamate--homocysteine methyltransferase